MPPTASAAHDAAILGLKLTVGAEMLLADAGESPSPAEPPPNGPAWLAFEASLEKSGYFHDLLPGSVGHQQRLQQAHIAFAAGRREERDSPAAQAARLLHALPATDVATWRARQGPLAPADDDKWMRDGAADLEAELATRQAERDVHQAAARQVAERVAAFVEGVGDVEGAEVPAALEVGVDVSMDAVLRELREALGGVHDDAVSSDEGSSFFSDPDSSDGDSEEEAGPSGGVLEEHKAGGFFAAYLDELESQLRGTTVPKTFVATADTPVDVDANLVANLLASVDMQQGMAGPASNLAGMVGLDVGRPSNEKRT